MVIRPPLFILPKGVRMRRWNTVVIAAALLFSLTGCQVEEPRIKPEETTAQELWIGPEETDAQKPEVSGGTAGQTGIGETQRAYKTGRKGDDYILPDAREHVYTQSELSNLTPEELRLARNEIYARYGRRFKSDDLNRYFSERPWYQGTIDPDIFDSGLLSHTEKDNLNVIQEMEEGMSVCAIPKIGTEEFPMINGSTATLPISQAIYRMSTGASEKEAEAAIFHGKTNQAWMNLIMRDSYQYKEPLLVIAYEPGEAVWKALEGPAANPVIMKPIGRDALVFLANKSNSVHSLTGSQLVDIYSGKITNWKDVGGKDRKIQAFQRPEDSGSQNLMDKLVMKGITMADAPSEQVVDEMGELLEKVSAYDGAGDALGYSVYYYAGNMYRKQALTFMAVDGVMPSNETIRNGSYPFTNDFYAAIRADTPKDSKAYELFEWLTSEDGQSLINGLGYVSIGEGAKGLPEELLAQDGDFRASIPLPEGKVILADGEYLYGEQGIGVFDSHMNLIRFISHVECEMEDRFMECDSDVVLPMTDTRTRKEGYYSIGKNQWVEWKKEEEKEADDSVYNLEEFFVAEYPELLRKYGVTAKAVEIRYSRDENPVIAITDQTTEHYYDLNGTFLLDFDTNGKSEDRLPYRRVCKIDDRMAYIQLIQYSETDMDDEMQYLIYEDGRLIRTLRDEYGNISNLGRHFYTRSNGSYLYIYNYQDEPCAKFLHGYYGND